MSYKNIHPAEFVGRLADLARTGRIIDVREPHEWAYYHLDEAVLMPMHTIPGRLGELPDDVPLYIVCAHGVRSERVCHYLAENGFRHVVNVMGGMAAIAALRGFQYD